jgi:cell division topological specificity factor
MRDFLRWVIAHKEQSKRAARDRLRLALIKDRLDLSEGTMDALRQDVLMVLSRYMVVGDDFQEFEIHRSEESVFLISNIQVKEVPRWAVVSG